MSVLHLNTSSISAHIDDLWTFLNLFNDKFDIICSSESRISTKHPQTTDLPGFNIEQMPTESSGGGTLFYISQNLSYKPATIFIIFWDFLVIYKTFLAPQVKRWANVIFSQGISKLSHELTNDFRRRILGNYEIWGKRLNFIA